MNILIADDSTSFRALLRGDLEEAGFSVVEAEDGEAALAAFRAEGPFDLILTDVNMPDMDGLAFARHLRAEPNGGETPIFILSAERSPAGKEQAKEAGVTAWIVKPYVKEILIRAISRFSTLAA